MSAARLHPDPDYGRFAKLWPAVRELQALAAGHGIHDIFQDNGGKILQVLLLLHLRRGDGREGVDALDGSGNEYELKSVNRKLTKAFSTHHHLNLEVLANYRGVHAWYFAVYEHIELVAIYRVEPPALEPYFRKWEAKWRKRNPRGTLGGKQKDINNPKIPISHVETVGERVYP